MLLGGYQVQVGGQAQHQLYNLDAFQGLLNEGDSLLAARGVGAKDQDRHVKAFVEHLVTEGAFKVAPPVFNKVRHELGEVARALIDRQARGVKGLNW